MKTPHSFKQHRLAAALALALIGTQALAVSTTTENGTVIDFSSTLSFGAQVRLKSPNPQALGNDNGGNVPTSAPLGSLINGPGNNAAANPDFNFLNSDDGNLNYRRGDIVSAPLKGTHELGVKTTDGWRVLLRGSWVLDPQAAQTRRTELSSEAKGIAVHNFTLLDAWVSKDFRWLDDKAATVRLGNQVLSWGEDIFIIGGINQTNALDLRKLHTPGTQVKEILRPAPMLSLNTALSRSLSMEAYYQFGWNAYRFDPVGTFFSTADVVGAGQRPAYIPSSVLGCPASAPCGDHGTAIQPGLNVVGFEADHEPPQGKQYGLALRFKPQALDTEFSFYYQRYHDKLPFTTLFTDPAYAAQNVANIGYYNEYGQNKDLFGFSFNTKAGPIALGGELSYRPKDSVAIDGSVPLSGRYSIFDPANADAKGRATVRGFVEEKKIQAHLTGLYFTEVNSPMGALVKALGAAEGTVLAEVAVTHYPNLKTSEIPYLVFPTYASPDKTSWGYAMEFDLSYPHIWGSDWNLTQSTVFTHDVKGVSPNTLPFLEGRKSLFLGLLFDKGSEWKWQLGYTAFFGGGQANLLRDRDNIATSLSFNF
ncbi:DUF1302 domain-containing protein [Paucibacter sp. KBW04]|uniref:DUF1302 domain-containing protein n=1 Tax=Paucibacter sp. KBW04 TaxID=2153361 RepID=UPI000F55D50C|nr:DUF1302 domain-containing protein [Paucibacter sp. KBW04]RQO63540.1 DUF1302 domain-containing protein [Paucibacter sp. KBW04]